MINKDIFFIYFFPDSSTKFIKFFKSFLNFLNKFISTSESDNVTLNSK